MPFSMRLDRETERTIARLAKERGQSRAMVVREAVAAFGRDPGADAPTFPASAWDALQHLVGIADGGGGRASEDTGKGFTARVRDKARARRSR
jgi:hypothetical protein